MSGPALIENILYYTFDLGYITPFQDIDKENYSSVLEYFIQNSLDINDINTLYGVQKLKFDFNPELKVALMNTTGKISFPFLQDEYSSILYSKVLECLRSFYKNDEDYQDMKIELGLN